MSCFEEWTTCFGRIKFLQSQTVNINSDSKGAREVSLDGGGSAGRVDVGWAGRVDGAG